MSAFSELRDKIRDKTRAVLGRPFRYLAAEWDRMGARQRRSLTILAIAVVVVATALSFYLVSSNIGDLEESNADVREALAAITKHRDTYLEAKSRAQTQEARLGSDTPQLVADIEAAAREESLQIAESNERPPSNASKRWIEHDVDLKVRGVDLQTLTKFLKRVETGPRPVFFTHIALKRRFSEADKLDAELTAIGFERVKEKAPPKKKSDGSDSAGELGGSSGRNKSVKESQ